MPLYPPTPLILTFPARPSLQAAPEGGDAGRFRLYNTATRRKEVRRRGLLGGANCGLALRAGPAQGAGRFPPLQRSHAAGSGALEPAFGCGPASGTGQVFSARPVAGGGRRPIRPRRKLNVASFAIRVRVRVS